MTLTRTCFLLLACILIRTTLQAHPTDQPLGLDARAWATVISQPAMSEPNSLGSMTLQMLAADSLRASQFLDSLEAAGRSKGYYFTARYCMTKADYVYKRAPPP